MKQISIKAPVTPQTTQAQTRMHLPYIRMSGIPRLTKMCNIEFWHLRSEKFNHCTSDSTRVVAISFGLGNGRPILNVDSGDHSMTFPLSRPSFEKPLKKTSKQKQ